MRKAKAVDVAFEDRVWAALARLQFTTVNKGRKFEIACGGGGDTRHVNVFAADDEVVLLVQCIASMSPTSGQLSKELDAVQETRSEVLRAIKRELPDHKVKFILATKNLAVTSHTSERIAALDVSHMDEDIVDYYLDLSEHLGKAARFQLLGNLFAGTKIPGLEPKVVAIQCRMGGHIYYSFAIEPDRLLKMGYILHRNKANSDMMPTYQRLIKRSRLQKVSQFVQGGGYFPNSIILNIESGRRGLHFDLLGRADGEAKVGMLHLPQTYRAAYIIDGQHRLYGYADSSRAATDLVPVVAFVDLDRSEQVKIFMQINENQQAVPKNLRNTLNADLLWDSRDLREQQRALKLRIAQFMGENRSSPLFGRIILGEEKRTSTRCITIDAVSRGLDRGNFLGSFSKSQVRNFGTLYRGTNEASFDAATRFLSACLWHIREGLESQWALGAAEGGFLFVNNGVESMLRIFSDVLSHVGGVPATSFLDARPEDLYEECKTFLDTLVTYVKNLRPEDAAEYRRMYGSGGGTRYWRRLQAAIREARPEFDPPGLDAYLAGEAKAYNLESFDMVRDLEQFINRDLQERLENEYGARWFREGVPRAVRESASKLAAERNLDLDPGQEVTPWQCLYLIDYYSIVTQDHGLWMRTFAKQYTMPGDESKPGTWKLRASWIQRLNSIRNDLAHGRSVSSEVHDFLVVLTTWLVKGQADNDL